MIVDEVRRSNSDAPVAELPFASRLASLTEYVYAIRCYMVQGVDVAIWERNAAGNYRRFVYATGPLYLTPQPLALSMEPEDPSLTRSERIWKRLQRSDNVEAVLARWSRIYEEEGPLAESDVAISEDEFQAAVNLARQFHPGLAVLANIGIRVVARSAGSVIDCDTSSGGNGDFNTVFGAANQLFRQAGIEELEDRVFSM